MLKPYKKLATLYDAEEWGKFSLKYIAILNELKRRYHFSPNNILDISCGTGELINELSKECQVVGSDISAEMIKIARIKYPHRTFYISDMADLRLKEKYDLILSPFDSVNYIIQPDHLERAFRNIYYLLNEKGYFLFDFNTNKLYEDKHKGTIARESEGIYFKQICKYNKNNKIAKTIFDFGIGLKEVHIQKSYNFIEIKDALENAGFEIIDSIDMFNNEAITDQSYKILIFAQKIERVRPKGLK